MLYRFKNLAQNFGNISYNGNNINSMQFINLKKHNIFPDFNNLFMKHNPSYLIVNSGKIVINMKKYDKKNKYMKNVTLFAEDNILYKQFYDKDIILTDKKYIITIFPHVYFSFYSYDNTNFQLYFKSNNRSEEYTNINNKFFLSKTNKLI